MNALKKINNNYLYKKDITEEKLNSFTSALLDIVNNMYTLKKFDQIIIPYVLDLYKVVFQKQLKASTADKTKNPKQKSQGSKDADKFKDPVQIQINADILMSFFDLALLLIVQENDIPVKININSLTFIHKFVEDAIPITINQKSVMVIYSFNYIIE